MRDSQAMRSSYVLAVVAALMACAPAPKPPEVAKPDPTTEAWYPQTVADLVAINHEAEGLFQHGKFDAASELVSKGQPLEEKLLSVPKPTLAAMEAASDLDDLYGRMLQRNRHYSWARSFFQKNAVRWKAWKPQTPDTERRRQAALAAVAECDRHPE